MRELLVLISLFLFPFLTFALPAPITPQVSMLFVDLNSGKMLGAENPDKQLVPASVSKLFPASTALKRWGSAYTFSTPVYARGELKQGILKGDLVLYGAGDPMLINEKMWELTNTLQRFGLKQVQGNLIINNSYFGTVNVNDADRIAAKNHSMESYDSLVSSAGSNFGTVAVSIFPDAKAGMPAKLALIPAPLETVALTGHVVTTDKSDIQLTRNSKDDREWLTISGTIEPSAPVTLYRSVGDPDLMTGALLKSFLQHAGVTVTGEIRVESTPLKVTDKPLVTVESVPLSQVVSAMLINSNNFIADVLTLDLWRQQHSQRVSSIVLAEAANDLLVPFKDMRLHSMFASPTTKLPHLDSGSGLTPTNQLSARDVVILLDGMYQDTRDFPALYGALVVPGQQTEWRHVKTAAHPWMSRVSVKTGGLKNPTVVYSLAGYVRMKNGDMGAFALLLNQPGQPDKKTADVIVQQLQDILIKRLDNLFKSEV
jgi:D-alanyl-D-alanine carboxypeptidase/D-alanyl-D-alanine-endopeptidase (penicillin-binding protein 4)